MPAPVSRIKKVVTNPSPYPNPNPNQANCCDASEAYLSCAPEGRADASLATGMERYAALETRLPAPYLHYHLLLCFSPMAC